MATPDNVDYRGKELGTGRLFEPSVRKVCQGCPDRFEGCVKLSGDQSLPQRYNVNDKGDSREFAGYCVALEDMLKEGWRKVEVKDGS